MKPNRTQGRPGTEPRIDGRTQGKPGTQARSDNRSQGKPGTQIQPDNKTQPKPPNRTRLGRGTQIPVNRGQERLKAAMESFNTWTAHFNKTQAAKKTTPKVATTSSTLMPLVQQTKNAIVTFTKSLAKSELPARVLTVFTKKAEHLHHEVQKGIKNLPSLSEQEKTSLVTLADTIFAAIDQIKNFIIKLFSDNTEKKPATFTPHHKSQQQLLHIKEQESRFRNAQATPTTSLRHRIVSPGHPGGGRS